MKNAHRKLKNQTHTSTHSLWRRAKNSNVIPGGGVERQGKYARHCHNTKTTHHSDKARSTHKTASTHFSSCDSTPVVSDPIFASQVYFWGALNLHNEVWCQWKLVFFILSHLVIFIKISCVNKLSSSSAIANPLFQPLSPLFIYC